MEDTTADPSWTLIDAAGQGNLAGVKTALGKGADVNYLFSSDEGSWGALHLAAYNGHLDVTNFLLESGADVDAISSFYEGELLVGGSALHLAAHAGHLKIMESLIAKGSNLNGSDGTYDYLTPLHTAARDGQLEVVKLLLEKGADINALNGAEDTAVTSAAENGQLEILKYLKSKGAALNVSSNVQTPLLAAAENGHLAVVQFLIENGVGVNEGAKFRKDTALHMASMYGFADIIKYLLGKGADKKAVDNDGKTPAQVAHESLAADVKALLN